MHKAVDAPRHSPIYRSARKSATSPTFPSRTDQDEGQRHVQLLRLQLNLGR